MLPVQNFAHLVSNLQTHVGKNSCQKELCYLKVTKENSNNVELSYHEQRKGKIRLVSKCWTYQKVVVDGYEIERKWFMGLSLS